MNTESIVGYILLLCATYLVIGVLFSLFFYAKGITKVDQGTEGSGLGFKLLILPGCIAFWPVLLSQWIKKLKT